MAGRGIPIETGEVVNLSDKYKVPEEMMQNLDTISWDMLANLASDFRFEFQADNLEIQRLTKELHVARAIIVDRLKSHSGGTVSVDSKFLIDLVRLLEKLEAKQEKHGVKYRDFLNFLFLLIEKMKREKLVVFDIAQRKYVDSYKSHNLKSNAFTTVSSKAEGISIVNAESPYKPENMDTWKADVQSKPEIMGIMKADVLNKAGSTSAGKAGNLSKGGSTSAGKSVRQSKSARTVKKKGKGR